MDIKEVYNQLTNVDIEAQKQLWDERGKGYYGEYLVFCRLYKEIQGNCKILMNLNVPTEKGGTTEIDLVLIHESGIYVFEIKHYKGTIYGKDTDATWTQYFRTVKNNVFKSPIKQNEYHINALKKLIPNAPIYSCVVFTSNECDLRVANSNDNIDICLLSNIHYTLDRRFTARAPGYTMQDIDSVFEYLSQFSDMQKPVEIDAQESSFLAWVQPTITKLEEARKSCKRSRRNGIIANIAVALASVLLAVVVILGFHQGYEEQIQKNNSELAQFKQNFLHVDEINNSYITAANEFVNVSNVSISRISDNATSFTARLSINSDDFGIALTKESRYIVMTESGKVYEYDVFGEHLSYNWAGNIIGKGIRTYADLKKANFFGITRNEKINYIKVTGVNLFKLDINRTIIKGNLELELYSK